MKDVAQFLKVIADESRLQILWLLLNHEELCVCELVEALGGSQSKVSRHLATLRAQGGGVEIGSESHAERRHVTSAEW